VSEFRFTIPGQPPTGNLLYDTVRRFSKTGAPYLGRAKKAGVSDYQFEVMHAAHRAMPPGWNPGPWNPKTGEGLIVVRFWFYLKRAVDADNAMKVINDGIKVGLGTKEAKSRSGRVRVVPIYDDERFLGQAWWLVTGCAEPRVDVELLTDVERSLEPRSWGLAPNLR
jgi:hypothetical protein